LPLVALGSFGGVNRNFFAKQIAYSHDGIDLFLRESRQQIPSN